MGFGSYAELKASIDDWLNRDDLSAVSADFIRLAEADFNRKLRTTEMRRRGTFTIDSQYASFPNDWLETISVTVAGERTIHLEMVSRDDLAEIQALVAGAAGDPAYYALTAKSSTLTTTVIDGQTTYSYASTQGIEVAPIPAAPMTATINYYQRIPSLSNTAQFNWLLGRHPDIYLYGALVQSAPYLDEDPRVATWAALYQQAIDSANAEDRRARFSGSGLKIRIRSY